MGLRRQRLVDAWYDGRCHDRRRNARGGAPGVGRPTDEDEVVLPVHWMTVATCHLPAHGVPAGREGLDDLGDQRSRRVGLDAEGEQADVASPGVDEMNA